MCTCKKNSLAPSLFNLVIGDAEAYSKFASPSVLKFTQSGGSSSGDYDSSSNAVIVENVNENEELTLEISGTAQQVEDYNAPIRLVENYNVNTVSILKDNVLSVAELEAIKLNNGVVSVGEFANIARYVGLNIPNEDDWFDTLTFGAIYYRLLLMDANGQVAESIGSVGRTAFNKVVSGTRVNFLYLDDSYIGNGYELLLQVSNTSFANGVVPSNMATCTVVVNPDGTCTLAY